MDDVRRFSALVVVEDGRASSLRRVGSVREAAECLLERWPMKDRGARYRDALLACHDALAGEIPTEEARQAFIAAAREVDVFVGEAPLRG